MSDEEGVMGWRLALVGLTGLNLIVVAALLGPCQHASAAATAADTLRAKAIELVDQHGRVRAQLNVESDGEAVFRLRDSKGEIRVKLGAGEHGSGLLLLDGSTEPAIHLRAGTSDPTLTLQGKDGRRKAITP
jgi:hypothetical protein